MGMFDELLNQVAEADREVFKKYPQIAEKVDTLNTFVSKWEDWRAKNWDDDAKTTKSTVRALQEKDAEIEALKVMASGNDMNWDDLKANVETLLQQRGVVTKEQLDKDFLTKLNFAKPEDMKPIEQKIDNLAAGIEATYAQTGHLPLRYFKEFGPEAEEFTQERLFKHMNEHKIMKFEDGYNALVEPLRVKKREEESKKREEEIRKQAREEALREAKMNSASMPTDSSGAVTQQTALSRKIAERKKVEVEGAPKLTPGDLGSMTGANDAYKQYLADVATGKVQ